MRSLAKIALMSSACLIGAVGEPNAFTDTKVATRVGGGELVLRLIDPKTRDLAYFELSRRAVPEKTGDETTFRAQHRNPDVITCPQGEGQAPLYLILSRFLLDVGDSIGMGVRPAPPSGGLQRRNELLIEVFTSTGELIAPFGGKNVLDDGVVADLNSDGFVECASYTNYGIEGVDHVQVFEISRVRPIAEPLLAVVYNWGDRKEWDYRFIERDGRVDIEFGPITSEGVHTKATFRWDVQTKRYVGPRVSPGDHYRVIDAAQIWPELQRLKREGLAFSSDPDFVPPADSWDRVPPEIARRVAAAKPYRAHSLRSLSNAEILHYMGKGNNVDELELAALQENRIPDRFWELPARESALALADVNQSAEHRQAYDLSLSADRPTYDVGAVKVSDRSAPCYVRTWTHYFLKADQRRSYLVMAQTESAGTVYRDFVDDPTLYDVRICDVLYGDAKQVLNAISGLKRIESTKRGDKRVSGFAASSADGSGEIEVRAGRGEARDRISGSSWGRVAERWSASFDDEVALNLGLFLVEQALPERLGPAWKRLEPTKGRSVLQRDVAGRDLEPSEVERLSRSCAELLTLWSPDERNVSNEIAEVAVSAAGDYALPALESAVERVRQSSGVGSESVARLRKAATLALRKIHAASRPDLLKTWAASEEPANMWALRELLKRDPAGAVPALEVWLGRTTGPEARQVFASLAKAAPVRAREIAVNLTPERRKDLAVSAAALRDVGSQDVTELIRVASANDTTWEQRFEAIQLLVPPEAPLRHSEPEIDAALLGLLKPAPGDELNFTVAHAARALALRERSADFEAIRSSLGSAGPFGYEQVLAALSLIAARGTPDHRRALAEVIGPQLRQTDRMMSELLWSAFAADLRELRPDFVRIATESGEDVEGDKAHSSGGTVRPVTERYHLARKILAIWDEPDQLTRAKLLIAYAYQENPYPSGFAYQVERAERVRRSLRDSVDGLSREARDEAVAFLRECETTVHDADEWAAGLPAYADSRGALREILDGSPRDH